MRRHTLDDSIAEIEAFYDAKQRQAIRKKEIAALIAWIPLNIEASANELYDLRKERDEDDDW